MVSRASAPSMASLAWRGVARALSNPRGRRCFSACTDRTGSAQSLARVMQEFALPVAVPTRDIVILKEPSAFYECLASGVRNARHRVVLSTLYIGRETEKERGLIDALAEASRRGVRVSLLLDALRARRLESGSGSGSTTIAKTLADSLLATSSATDRPQVSLYHTPRLKGLLKSVVKPPYSEILGVAHMKAYVFDDLVVMSGANLNERYFADRQDRYVCFRSSALADRVAGLVGLVGQYSYRLLPCGGLGPPPNGVDPVASPKSFSRSLRSDLERALEPRAAVSETSDALAGDLLRDHALVFPLVQLGCVGYRQDEEATEAFLGALRSPSSKLSVSSGYLNLTRRLERQMLQTDAVLDFITASPMANGFFQSPNPSKALIPFVYQKLTYDLVKRMKARCGGGREVALREYHRPGWQYHCKGLWYTPGSGLCDPVATFVGSPNYGYRSADKDLEMQVCVISACEDLGGRLSGELGALMEHTKMSDLEHGGEARDSLLVSLSSKLCRKWL